MKKIKVLILAHSFTVKRNRQAVAKYLSNYKDIALKLICPKNTINTPGSQSGFESGQSEVYETISANTLFSKKTSFTIYTSDLKYIIKTWQPDIIDVFDETPWSWCLTQVILFKNLYSPSSKVISFNDNNIDRKWTGLRFFYKYFERFNYNHIDKMYCPIQNSGFEELARKRGYSGEISYLSSSVDTKMFYPLPERDIQKIRNKVGIKKEDFLMGIIGGAGKTLGIYYKGTLTAIRAMSKLPDNYKLILMGSAKDKEKDELINYAESIKVNKDRIIFTGFLPSEEVPLYYNSLNSLLAISIPLYNWAEPFGRMNIEAMACGIPVIGSKCGAIPAVLGEAGKIIEVDNDKQLYKAIKEISENKSTRNKLISIGLKRIKKLFSVEVVSKRRRQLYLQIINPKGKIYKI